uniref:Vacuolar protein sorting-associated protein 16 homolog n=1 Tax=Macrostomum lignano TaxID=282301 RepID=A0A1I8FDS1_9PLAT
SDGPGPPLQASDEANFIAALPPQRVHLPHRPGPEQRPESRPDRGQLQLPDDRLAASAASARSCCLLSQKEKGEAASCNLVEPGIDTYVELAIEELKRDERSSRQWPGQLGMPGLVGLAGVSRLQWPGLVASGRARGSWPGLVGCSAGLVGCSGRGHVLYCVPKDIICAQQRDRSDHLQWLLSRGKFKQALDDVKQGGSIGEFTAASVGRKYIDHLLSVGQFGQAAELCQTVLSGKEEWEAMAYQFHQAGCTSALAQTPAEIQAPAGHQRVRLGAKRSVQNDREQFLELINSWPSNLFSVRAVTRVVAEDLSRQPNDQILNRCLARLYELSGEHEKTLSILLKLRSCDAFALAGFSISSIISELSSNSGLLCDYLDAVHLKDPARVEKHADKMVELYADHARQKLLPFLRSSSGFKYELALALCADRQLTEETVYILARMGRRRDALNLLLDEQQFDRVVQFCRDEADPELWMAAAEAASDRPRLITTLLENSGSEVDPAILIHKIQPGMVVPGLRNSIVKLLSDYRVGTALTQGCATIQSQDCQNLIHKQIAFARRPMSVSPSSNLCVRCRTPLLVARRMGEARLTPARRTCCCSTAATTSMRSAARAARLPQLPTLTVQPVLA